jgi:hypothetical protein
MYQGEFELEAELEDLMALLTEGESEVPAPGAVKVTSQCPIDTPYVIRGFARYSADVLLLPPDQQNKLAAIAKEIADSQSGAPGTTPVTQVFAIGFADSDPAAEAKSPGFGYYESEKRAHAVLEDLNCRFIALTANSHVKSILTGDDWFGSGRGAKNLAVAAPRSEAERQCNRRVEVILVRGARMPNVTPSSNNNLAADLSLLNDLYHAALQGTSGKYDRPEVAVVKAREIAETALTFIGKKLQERAARCPALPDLQGFTPYFKDALQGTASKYENADEAVSKAGEIADYAGLTFVGSQHDLEWKYATLPQPMAPDCEPVKGKVRGPVNHMLCITHGHVVDITARMVIARNLAEYKP